MARTTDKREKILHFVTQFIQENHYAPSVREICAAVGMSQPAVSHQMRILKNARVVKCRRSGRNSCYSLDDDHVAQILNMGVEHVKEAFSNE